MSVSSDVQDSVSHVTPPAKLGRFAVVNSEIICFVPGKDDATTITDGEKTDVVNSTLLAQLSADKDSKSYEHVDAWLNAFMQVAGVTGWTIQSSQSFKSLNKGDLHTSIDIVVAKHIVDSTHSPDMRILEALLYLRGSKTAVGLSILEEHGKMKNAGTFQFVICEKSNDQELSIRLFPYAFHTREHVHSTIFQVISQADTYEMKYMQDPIIAVLDTNVHDRVRESIDDKIKGYLNTRVAFLPI